MLSIILFFAVLLGILLMFVLLGVGLWVVVQEERVKFHERGGSFFSPWARKPLTTLVSDLLRAKKKS